MPKGLMTVATRRGVLTALEAGIQSLRGTFHHGVLKKRFIKRNVGGKPMFLDLEDPGISRSLLLFGKRELEHRMILEGVLKEGMTVFDIGANIGYYALMELALVGDKGSVIAIEPSPSNVALLRKNLELNGYRSVPIIEAGVSSSSGVRPFHLSKMSNLGTFHDTGTITQHLSGETIDVRLTTVGEIAESYGAPDLLRMDVEGHEVDILNGCLSEIEAGRLAPMVLFETHTSRYSAENDISIPLTRLHELGYEIPLVASSSERGTQVVRSFGYEPTTRFSTDDEERALFEEVGMGDLLEILRGPGGLRAVLLTKAH